MKDLIPEYNTTNGKFKTKPKTLEPKAEIE